MNKDQILSFVRQILIAAGVLVVAKGVADESMVTGVIGTIITLISSLWSFNFHKTK